MTRTDSIEWIPLLLHASSMLCATTYQQHRLEQVSKKGSEVYSTRLRGKPSKHLSACPWYTNLAMVWGGYNITSWGSFQLENVPFIYKLCQ